MWRPHQITSFVVDPVNSTALLQYALAPTPLVTSVTPTFGSSLGGTTLTIAGSGLSSPTGPTTVVVNGIPCTVTAADATRVTCVTGPRPPPPDIPATGFVVTVGSVGNAVTAKDGSVMYR